ncbi:MAG: hypothetical protein V1797_08400 [Pseudomonadota bacterium]
MDLIAFLPPLEDPAGQPWHQRLRAGWTAGKVEAYSTLEDLSLRLGRPRGEPFLLFLHASRQPYLDRLLALRDLVVGLPLICVLPDDQPATLAMGHLLRPRLLLSQSETPEVIDEVLRKFQMRVKPSNRIE